MTVWWAFLFCTAVAVANTSYEGYKVFEIQPEDEDQLNLLRSFDQNPSFDFWNHPREIGLSAIIMVEPIAQKHFISILNTNQIAYKLLIEDVESTIEVERVQQNSALETQGRISFTAYARYPEIQAYLEQLAENYPDVVTLESIGSSYEGRDISMVKLSSGGQNKPIILVDGGIHAREWISPAFVTYLIQELVENEENRALLEEVDWYIIPVLNPDGYEHTHTSARLWRKTRSAGGLLCRGVDGNRNFDFHWMETGASSLQCSETFAGPSAFSESETSALRDLVLENNDRIKLYLTFHSYGNYLLYPWGWTSNLPDNADELQALAVDVEAAIAGVTGTRYTIGSSTNVLYAAAGGSDDWVKGVGGVELSYTIELPGGGLFGFDLPASRILSVCRETFEGIKVYQNYIVEKFVGL